MEKGQIASHHDAGPILGTAWETKEQLLPKHPMTEATNYTLNQ
jgi:hypothetical protein